MSKNSEENGVPFEVSPLRESAMQLHELYSELRQAGFTRHEALVIVCETIKGSKSD
jgi:hypothetical protein